MKCAAYELHRYRMRNSVCLGLGLEAGKKLGMTANWYGVSFKKNINVLKLVAIQFCVYSINH